jgi:hypothetical protein
MYLTAMTHREELFDLTLRWINDDFHPGDGETLTRIFVYESAISSVAVERVFDLLDSLFGPGLRTQRLRRKHDLRERVIEHLGVHTPRVDELAETFRRNPRYFFPHLPIDALVVTDEASRLVAIGRIKRMARVAEKVSFRLVEALFREIRATARELAGMRAAAAGVPLDALVSPPEVMRQDFILAEESVAGSLMNRTIRISAGALTINDVVGFKIVAPQDTLDRIPEALEREPGIAVREIERHSGAYNALNLLLDTDLPPSDTLTGRLEDMDWAIARQHGLDPDTVRRGIAGYVAAGEPRVRIELILTTPEELMEAEFGRSIHELRVLRLRRRQEYNGPLGQNAGYLIEYMLALAASPTIDIPEIPVKMYGRYLPEEIAALKRALYGEATEGGLLGTFWPHASPPFLPHEKQHA